MTQLNRLIGSRSAARDGVLMYDDRGVLISLNGEWVAFQGAVLTAPNSSQWRIVVDNSGNLSTEAV